jgi:hypothetical protein
MRGVNPPYPLTHHRCGRPEGAALHNHGVHHREGARRGASISLVPRHRRFLRAAVHLSQLSHFRGPAHKAPPQLVDRALSVRGSAVLPTNTSIAIGQPSRAQDTKDDLQFDRFAIAVWAKARPRGQQRPSRGRGDVAQDQSTVAEMPARQLSLDLGRCDYRPRPGPRPASCSRSPRGAAHGRWPAGGRIDQVGRRSWPGPGVRGAPGPQRGLRDPRVEPEAVGHHERGGNVPVRQRAQDLKAVAGGHQPLGRAAPRAALSSRASTW